MKNWNLTGKIKALVLVILFIPNLINPPEPESNFPNSLFIPPIIFGILGIPLIAKMNSFLFKQTIVAPNWNDNPITFRRPLSFFHFFAMFFIVIGISIIIGTGFHFHEFQHFGLISTFYGIGILGGIQFTLKLGK